MGVESGPRPSWAGVAHDLRPVFSRPQTMTLLALLAGRRLCLVEEEVRTPPSGPCWDGHTPVRALCFIPRG